MVCMDDEPIGFVEVWDFASGGDPPKKNNMVLAKNASIAKVVEHVSTLFGHTVGTFGLLLKWDRNKVNLMDVKRDQTLADLGVDFTTETTHTLLITEWPLCMDVDSIGSFEVWDFACGGDLPRKNNMVLSKNVSIAKFVEHVSTSFGHNVGTFGLLLKWGRNKVNIMDVKRDQTLADLGVDFTTQTTYTLLITEWPSSPSESDEMIETHEKGVKKSKELGITFNPRMWLVEVTSESPTNETEDLPPPSPTDEDTMEDSSKVFIESIRHDRSKGRTKERNLAHGMVVNEEFEHDIGEVCSVSYDSDEQPRRDLDQRSEGVRRRERTSPWPTLMKKSEDGETSRRGKIGYVGLVNQAMTCYLNSLIQALYMTPEFRNALYNWEYVNGSEKDEIKSIPYQLQKLFLNLQTSSKNAIETTSLTKSFGWDSTEAWQQHDIQELCRVMFDALEQKFKNTEQADLINRLYEGKMMDYVKCLECGTEKSREDTFLDIPLPVRPFGSNVAYNSVEEALGAFVQPETLDGTNQYHCETCNKKCDAHKGLKFTKFPYFLTLHLKRFDFDYNTFHRIKLNDEVTFPDLLNLNSFIPSTTSEDSTCTEEFTSVSVKRDDTSTTDSGNLDNDCTACDNGTSVVGENSTSVNHDFDDEEDEGIERSNGPSTSSCNSNNHDIDKNRDNLPGPRGPYEYELFSIMIHSGSASGGHYYAYIKDFKTGEWLCFNDQNVSTITYDDIQKTYGGGPTRAYYSGVYSSSSNAYMLMYRQIDPVRNALPMQVVDFPKHLQELLIKMQDNDDNDTRNRSMLTELFRPKVFCHHPIKKTTVSVKLLSLSDQIWSELTDRAYRALGLETVVPREQVRLVTYQENNGLIDCSFDEREHETIRSILVDQSDLLMEIRKEDETFQTYLPGGVAKKIYVCDITTKEITKGPLNIRGRLTQTIQEYKEQLGMEIGMEPKDINIILQYLNNQRRLVTTNESNLQDEGFASATRIFVPISSGPDAKKVLENMNEILDLVQGLISLNIQLPDLSEEELRSLSIPTLEEKRIADATPLTNGPQKLSSTVEITKETEKMENNVTPIKLSDNEQLTTIWSKTTSPPTIQTETEDWHTPEQSNSEDSSLSYSDRTLVGEGDASEDDDYPLANVDHELSNQTNQDNSQVKDPTEYFFKVTRDEHEPDKLLRVLVDKRMILGKLKKLLEPHIGVPMEYFRVFCQPAGEIECTRLSMETSFHDDGATIWIKLGLALRNDEFKVALYQLCLDSESEPYRYLCEWIVSKDTTVGQTKKEILVELKRKFDIDIPHERCRLRRKNYKTAANVFLDDQKVKDLRFCWPREVIVQELPGKETIVEQTEVVIFARRMPKPGVRLGPIEELVVSGKSLTEVRERLSEVSGIPEEYLEMAKGKSSLPDDLMQLILQNFLDWNRQLSANDDCQPVCLEDGTVMYYRDSRDQPHELSAAEVQDIESRRQSRAYGVSSSSSTKSRYSPRRERALKIYVDDM